MFRKTRRHPASAGKRRAAATMEAALVMLPLIYLTFGSIEAGYFFFMKHTFQGAAREGARAGIVPGATNAQVVAAVNQTMTAAGVNSSKYTVSIRNAGDTANLNVATATASTGVLVKVTGTWGTLSSGIRAPYPVFSSSREVAGRTVMRKE